jgi:glycosyltransferase involved in cell wall biosynthesis
MNNHPLVSIIACCYNHEEFVEETLDGIISQTYEKIELIIIDDFSTDNSVKKINNWIKKHKYECLFIQNTENLGVVKTLNKALKKCNGKYLSLIACDDIYLPKKTENQIQIFEKLDDDYAAIYSDAYIINDDGIYQYGTQISRKQINKPPSGNIYEDLIRKDNFIPALSVIYKTEIIKELGYYDESLIYEDYDMLLRLSKQYKIYFSKEIDVCYRLHQTNMNYNLDKPIFLDSKIKILFKHLNTENSNSEIGIVIKEKILYLCELLYMQKSQLITPHLDKLRSIFNYGKIIFFSNYFKFSWKFYLIVRVIFVKRQQRVILNIK